jgi:hypothetical protein
MSNNHIRRQTQQEMTYRYRSPFNSSYFPSSRWLNDDFDLDRNLFSRPYWNDRTLRDSHRLADGVGDVCQLKSLLESLLLVNMSILTLLFLASEWIRLFLHSN